MASTRPEHIGDHRGPSTHLARAVIDLRSPAEIEQMKHAGRFVAYVLTRLEGAADVGVNLLELDAMAHDLIRERGAESCYIDYRTGSCRSAR